jgi:DNA repair photolyase
MSGCSNNCWYCYARADSIRFKRKTTEDWAVEEPLRDKVNKGYSKREGTIMFPTSHDITEGNLEFTLPVLTKLIDAGNKVLVVSKPKPETVEPICDALSGHEDQILFRFTIGSMDPSVLAFWEPDAPTFAERLYSLMYAWRGGWQTSVSMEPMLDCHEFPVCQMVNTLAPYITDSIWIGKMNKVAQRLSVNRAPRRVLQEAEVLEAAWDDAAILELYDALKDHPKVKWKDGIKKIVGLEVPTEAGLDV